MGGCIRSDPDDLSYPSSKLSLLNLLIYLQVQWPSPQNPLKTIHTCMKYYEVLPQQSHSHTSPNPLSQTTYNPQSSGNPGFGLPVVYFPSRHSNKDPYLELDWGSRVCM